MISVRPIQISEVIFFLYIQSAIPPANMIPRLTRNLGSAGVLINEVP